MAEVENMRVEKSDVVAEKAQGGRRGPFHFAVVVLLFILPLLIAGLLVEAVLWRTGESWPMERVIAAQQGEGEALFMRGVLDQGFYRYKALNIEQRKPRVLVLGSSRVMEFRKEMFGIDSFYNAGGMIQTLGDLKAFTENLTTEQTPEVVLLGIDVWWLSGAQLANDGWSAGARYEAARDWQAHLKAARRFKSSRVYKPASRAVRAGNSNIGIEARTKGVGFREDGSMRYAFAIPQTEQEWTFVDREDPPIPERIQSGRSQFIPNAGMEEGRAQMLGECIAELTKRKVLVLGFFPPFSMEAAALMRTNPGQSNLWNQTRGSIPQIFAQHGQPFFDASTTDAVGADDRYLLDGLHASETFQVHLLLKFLEEERVSEKFPKLTPYLKEILRLQGSNPWHPDFRAGRKVTGDGEEKLLPR